MPTWGNERMEAAQQVIEAAEARASALADGDAERLSGLLHEDFRWTAHLGETYDRQEYIRRNTDGRTVWRSQDLTSADVVVVGDTAVLYAEVTDVCAHRRRGAREVPDADDTGLGPPSRRLEVPGWARRTAPDLTPLGPGNRLAP